MSEPCVHERTQGSDAITSFVTQTRALVKAKAERDAALVEVKRMTVYIKDLREAIGVQEGVIDRRNITIERVRAIVDDPHVFKVERIRAALEPTP